MAKGDVLVRMKADVSSYNANIASANRTLSQFKQANLTASGVINQFTKSLTTAAAGYLGLASAGSAVAELVNKSVELAKAGEGIRIAFQKLNSPDLLNGLREATHGTVTDIELMKSAVKFNDFKLPLDQLGTMLAFAQQKAKDTGQSVDFMVDSIVTGLGRKSLMILDNLGLSANEVKEKMKETGDMTKAVGEIIREQMSKAGDYVETAADRALQANVSIQNKMEELGRKFAPVQEASSQLWASMKLGILDIIGGPLTTLLNMLTEAGRLRMTLDNVGGSGKVGRLLGNLSGAAEGSRQQMYDSQVSEFWRYINRRENYMKNRQRWVNNQDDEGLRQQLLSEQRAFGTNNVGEIQRQISAAKIMLNDYRKGAHGILNPSAQTTPPPVLTGGGGGTSTVKSPTFDDFLKQISKVDTEKLKPEDVMAPPSVWSEYADGIRESLNIRGDETIQTFDRIKDSMDNLIITSESYKKAQADIADEEAARIKRQQQLEEAQNLGAQAAMNFGAALAGLEDPAAKAAGTVISAIANIALGFGQAVASAGKMGPWAWLAYVAAGTAALATTISTVHSLTGYQNGGMIKGYSTGGTIQGNSYSGDNIGGMVDGSQLIGLNAGEVVLNAAQQNSLAQTLSGNMRSIHVVGKISGTDIILSADRTLMTQGKQLAVWGR